MLSVQKGNGSRYLMWRDRSIRVGGRWKWDAFGDPLSGVTLPFLEADWHHAMHRLVLACPDGMGRRFEVGKVDKEWHGAKVFIVPPLTKLYLMRRWLKGEYRCTWGWGVAFFAPLFDNMPVMPDYEEG